MTIRRKKDAWIYDREGIYPIGMTACMMILWWRFLVRLADDRSDGMDSMQGELVGQPSTE